MAQTLAANQDNGQHRSGGGPAFPVVGGGLPEGQGGHVVGGHRSHDFPGQPFRDFYRGQGLKSGVEGEQVIVKGSALRATG